jgi:hypothetical protein
MADFYASEFQGVIDKTYIPNDRADARVTGYRPRGMRASKPVGQALAVGDRLYIGRKRQGETVGLIFVTAGLALGTTTISVGTTAAPTRYVNGKTTAIVDQPVPIGPDAGSSENDPDNAYDDLWATINVAGIAAGTNIVFETIIRGLN